MIERHIYAHWLDPDYSGPVAIPSDQLEEHRQQFLTFLKMHALAGDCIHISDIQLIESKILMLAFADLEFRRFMKKHPNFLRLIAQPNDQLGATSERLARVSSGLARISSFGGTYIPNAFNSAAVIPGVAALLKGFKTEADAEIIFGQRGSFTRYRESYRGPDRELVTGLYYALEHFLTNPQAAVPFVSLRNTSSYYTELENALVNVSNDRIELRTLLQQTLALAENEQQRFRRSLVLPKLSHTNQVGHPDRAKYLTIAQAWNVAVGLSMRADCDSAYCFRGVFPVPIHSGLVTGRATFNVRIAQEDETPKSIYHAKWHPGQLDWKIVSKIREAYAREIEEYQETFAPSDDPQGQLEGDATEANFSSLAKLASRVIAEDRLKLPAPPALLSPIVAVASYVGFGIAATALGAHPKAYLTGLPGLITGTYPLIREAILRKDAHQIGKSLEDFGLQYNLHRST